MTKVSEAFEAFRASALKQGLPEPLGQQHPKSFGSRLLTIERDGAALRLVWDGKEEELRLEIAHGVSAELSWLELFACKCQGGEFPIPAYQPDFASSLEYGFSLMTSEP